MRENLEKALLPRYSILCYARCSEYIEHDCGFCCVAVEGCGEVGQFRGQFPHGGNHGQERADETCAEICRGEGNFGYRALHYSCLRDRGMRSKTSRNYGVSSLLLKPLGDAKVRIIFHFLFHFSPGFHFHGLHLMARLHQRLVGVGRCCFLQHPLLALSPQPIVPIQSYDVQSSSAIGVSDWILLLKQKPSRSPRDFPKPK